jgi:hypothetical protein
MKYFQTEFMLKDREVTESKYYEMLSVVPPTTMIHNAFLVGEPVDHIVNEKGEYRPRYDLYFTEAEKYYYGGLTTVADFILFTIEK